MCNLECCKEETFFELKASKPTGENMDMNFIISMFSSYHLTSQSTQILGSFSEQLTYFSQLCFLPPITIGNSRTLTRLTNLTHCLQVPKYSPPSLSGFPSPTYWYGQTLNLITRRHQISLALEIFFFLPFLLCYTERNRLLTLTGSPGLLIPNT